MAHKSIEQTYKVYILNTAEGLLIDPPLAVQLEQIEEEYIAEFGVEPDYLYRHMDVILAPLPDKPIVAVEGYNFTTGYVSDDPGIRT